MLVYFYFSDLLSPLTLLDYLDLSTQAVHFLDIYQHSGEFELFTAHLTDWRDRGKAWARGGVTPVSATNKTKMRYLGI